MSGEGEHGGEDGESLSISPFDLPHIPASGFLDSVTDADTAPDMAIAADKLIAFAHAVQHRALARFAALQPSTQPGRVEGFAADEVAAGLGLSLPVAAERLATAHTVVSRLPRALAALQDGRIGMLHASRLAEAVDERTPAFPAGRAQAGNGLQPRPRTRPRCGVGCPGRGGASDDHAAPAIAHWSAWLRFRYDLGGSPG
jgi:hypothetical protein